MPFERREIRIIADIRQADHCNIHRCICSCSGSPPRELLRHAVLFVEVQPDPRNNAREGDVAVFGKHVEPRLQQAYISAEFVDDQSFDAGPLFRPQKLYRSEKLREDTAGVDIARNQHRRVHHFSEPHVDKIPFPQVDLNRAACPLDHDDIRPLTKPLVCGKDIGDERFFDLIVVGGAHFPNRSAVYDDLRRRVAHGF